MSDKIKITKAELDDMYDIEDVKEEKKEEQSQTEDEHIKSEDDITEEEFFAS